MSKVYIISIAISLILGNARAQVSQVDMRIGSFDNLRRQDISREDDNLKSLDLESYKDVASLESAISPDKYILGPGDELGISIIARDREVDEIYNSLFRELLTYMMEDARNITACMHLHFIAKNIERMGDHVTSIAEQVIFVVTGELPAERRDKADITSTNADLSKG